MVVICKKIKSKGNSLTKKKGVDKTKKGKGKGKKKIRKERKERKK